MFGHYLELALRSFRRSMALTTMIVVLIGCGVAACMVSWTVFRATSADPIPSKSERLFVPQIDSFGPAHNDRGEPPVLLSYPDATALLRAHRAQRQALVYTVKLAVVPADPQMLPFSLPADAVTSAFFPMLDAPFRYGSAWGADDDERHASVVVINSTLNQKLFGGTNSVGRSISLGGHDYRVVGVLDGWNPQPRYFDTASAYATFGDSMQVFIPFDRAIDLQMPAAFNAYCSSNSADPSFVDWSSYLNSRCAWIAAWVELLTPAEARRYLQYLHDYAAEQQRIGRFDWPPNVRLRNVRQWLGLYVLHVVPKASSLSMLVSLSFLFVCLVNVVGLMLARCMRRAPEIGVRRALGASRGAICSQFLVEAVVTGAAGGLLGVLLTLLGMACVNRVFEPPIARLAHADASLLLLAVWVAMAATVAAALYPAWRAAQVQPSWQIKSNG